MIDAFVRAVRMVSLATGILAAFMIAAAVLITCQMIYVRAVLNESTIWQTEAVTYLMISATLLGLPYVQLLRGHVNVDLVPVALKPAGQRLLAYFTIAIGLALCLAIGFAAYELWHEAWSRNWRSDTVWGVRLSIPYIAMPLGFFLLALQYIADLAALIHRGETPFGAHEPIPADLPAPKA